jgi:hypothetical protein
MSPAFHGEWYRAPTELPTPVIVEDLMQLFSLRLQSASNHSLAFSLLPLERLAPFPS